MSRDYRYGHNHHKAGFQRKSQQQETRPSRAVGRVWVIGLLVSVVFLGGFWVVQHFMSGQPYAKNQATSEIYAEVNALPEEPVNKQATITVEAIVADKSFDESVEAAEKPRTYSFYEGLKETEVVVDVVPISVKLEDAYYIYAGSFGSQEIALKEQRRLARFGQIVDLSPLHQRDRTYYRLRVGPYDDRLEMNKKRNELRALGVDTLLIKVPTAD